MTNFATIEDACEYLEHADQSESEHRAEYGMGAASLGYDPIEWAPAYDGYRTSDDPLYQEAAALVKARYSTVVVIAHEAPAARRARLEAMADDIPF